MEIGVQSYRKCFVNFMLVSYFIVAILGDFATVFSLLPYELV